MSGLPGAAVGSEVRPQRGGARLATVADVLACARSALGGSTALSRVSALSVAMSAHATAAAHGALPETDDVVLAMPDRFKRVAHSATPASAGGLTHVSIFGFSADKPVFGSGTGDIVARRNADDESVTFAHQEFARYAFAWLLRSTPVVPLTFSYGGVNKNGRAVVIAAGKEGFNATLSIDERTCLPVVLSFDRKVNQGDLFREQLAARAGQADSPTSGGSSDVRTETLSLSETASLAVSCSRPSCLQRSMA